jgi:hypothetical protein
VFLRDGYAGYATPCRVLVVVHITSFLPSGRVLRFLLFVGGIGDFQQPQGECSVPLHCGGQASKHQQSSGLPLSKGTGIPALEQDRHDAGRCSVKCWASVYLGRTGLLVPPA